jgi:hypothetical protein
VETYRHNYLSGTYVIDFEVLLSHVQMLTCFLCDLQLAMCRKLIDKHMDDVLKLENKFIKSYIFRQHQGGIAMCLGWRLTIEKQTVLYARIIEHGTLSGLFKRALEKASIHVVPDYLLTQSDIQRLKTTHSKSRADDWRQARKDFDKFVSGLDKNHIFASIVFAENNAKGLDTTLGQDWCGVNMTCVEEHLRSERVEKVMQQFPSLPTSTHRQLTLSEQLDLINQIPAQCIMSGKDRVVRLGLHLAWSYFAPKHTLLTQPHDFKEVISSYRSTLACTRQSRAKNVEKAKKRKRTQDGQDNILNYINRMTKMARALLSDDVSEVMARQFCSKLSPLQLFQNQLVDIGHIRPLSSTSTEVSVIWNKFDDVTSECPSYNNVSPSL